MYVLIIVVGVFWFIIVSCLLMGLYAEEQRRQKQDGELENKVKILETYLMFKSVDKEKFKSFYKKQIKINNYD